MEPVTNQSSTRGLGLGTISMSASMLADESCPDSLSPAFAKELACFKTLSPTARPKSRRGALPKYSQSFPEEITKAHWRHSRLIFAFASCACCRFHFPPKCGTCTRTGGWLHDLVQHGRVEERVAGRKTLECKYVSDLPVLYDTDRWSKSVLGLAPRLTD